MAEATKDVKAEQTPERVEKSPKLSGDVVVYRNNITGATAEMPGEDWDRLSQDRLTSNLTKEQVKKRSGDPAK